MFACQHLKYYNSEGPHVNALAVSLTSCLFWSHVQYGSHNLVYVIMSMKHIGMYFCTKTEVSNFGGIPLRRISWLCSIIVKGLINKYVLWLEIPVNKILLMNLK